jgi:hypothetical protein
MSKLASQTTTPHDRIFPHVESKALAKTESLLLRTCVQVVRPESELDFGRGPNGSTPAVCYKDVLRAMKKEVSLMESLTHPHIVEIAGTAEDCRVFVMERAVSDLYTIIKQHDARLSLGHAKCELPTLVCAPNTLCIVVERSKCELLTLVCAHKHTLPWLKDLSVSYPPLFVVR